MSKKNELSIEHQKNKGPSLDLFEFKNKNIKKEDNQKLKKLDNIQNNLELNSSDNFDISKIKELNSKSVDLIFEEKIELGLEILKKLELFLESNVVESKFNLDKKLIIIILHNLSCCYQKLKDYENCITYLEAVIYNFDKILEKKHKIKINEEFFYNNINKDHSNYSLLGDFILEMRFSAKFHLQMCAALSQANRHIEALKHAKLAGLICEDNLIKTHYLFIQMKLKNTLNNENENKNNNNENQNELINILSDPEKLEQTEQIINDLFLKIKNIRNSFNSNCNNNSKNNKRNFISYLDYRKTEIENYEKNNDLLYNIRNVFGSEIKKDDWIQLLNIGNIMYLSPLNEEDLDLESDSKYEILRDAILEKIVMLTVSYFCISIEMHQLSKDKSNKKTNGEFFLYHTVLFSQLYLPVSCPIVKHYINSYYEYFAKELDVIPEGKIFDYKIDVIKNEYEINKDMKSFIRLQKMNYINNTINNIIPNIKLDINKDNKNNDVIDIKENINNENQNYDNKKNKIPYGLKFNLNFADIIHNNINTNLNKSENFNNKSDNKTNIPINKKLTINNDNQLGNYSRKKNAFLLNDNLNNCENYQLLFNKNHTNIAERSKIKDLPKFKLNFNKINNLVSNNEENKLDVFIDFKKVSYKINNIYNNNSNIIKKLNSKISSEKKTKRNCSSSGNKIKKKNFSKNSGYKTERSKSNKKSINSNDTLIINKNDKSKKKEIKRNNYMIQYCSNKYLSKTSRHNKNEKSPVISTKNNKLKGNLTERYIVKNNNQNKPFRRSKKEILNRLNNKKKNEIGCQTQRELTYFKSKGIEKINLGYNINSLKKSKSPNNIKSSRKIKSDIKHKSNNNVNYTNNKSLNINIKDNNNFYNNGNQKFNNIKNNKVSSSKSKLNSKDKTKKNLIDNLFKNIIYIGIKKNNNKNYNENLGKINEFTKFGVNTGEINNINTIIKAPNPFKI